MAANEIVACDLACKQFNTELQQKENEKQSAKVIVAVDRKLIDTDPKKYVEECDSD